MIINYAFPRIRSVREDIIFQKDGVPLQYSSKMKACLKKKVSKRWTGRVGPFFRPLYSPDLIPCIFFLWGHIKSKINDIPIDSTEELRRKTRAELNRINQETLKNVWNNMKFRLNYITLQIGRYI